LNFAARAQRCASDFFKKFKKQDSVVARLNTDRRSPIWISQKMRTCGGEGMSMSGFERLDRLSLPRRTAEARLQDEGNDRGLEAHKIIALTFDRPNP
jgi:hypothetical protein